MSAKSSQGASRIWESLASVKLAVTLLILLSLGSVLGTVIPQGQPQAFYHHWASEAWAKVILTAQLDRVYSSFWFLLLVAALAVNLIVCSLNRLPKTLKSMGNTPTPEGLHLPRVRLSQSVHGAASPEEVHALVREKFSSLQGIGGRVVESGRADAEGKRLIFAQTGRFSRLGAYVVHLAILILMAGGLATALLGFKGNVWLHPGQVLDHIDLRSGQAMPLDFKVRLDKFIFEKYEDGSPKLWQSNLSFIKDGKVVETAQCKVNHPATFGKVTFYMSSYDQEKTLDYIGLEVMDKDGPPRKIRIKNKEAVSLEGLGRIEILDYDPNWRGGGFAAKIRLVREGAGAPLEFWVRPRPPFQMPPQGQEVPTFKLTDARAKAGEYLAGLQANYDPGIWFVWIGGIIMLLGLVVALFWSHRRFWAEIGPGQSGTRVVLAGSTQSNRPSFELKFKALVKDLEESLAGLETGKKK